MISMNMTASNVAGLFREAIEEETSIEPSDEQILRFARSRELGVREEIVVAMEKLFATGNEQLVPFEGGEWGELLHSIVDFVPRYVEGQLWKRPAVC